MHVGQPPPVLHEHGWAVRFPARSVIAVSFAVSAKGMVEANLAKNDVGII